MFRRLFGNPDHERIFDRIVSDTANALASVGLPARQSSSMARELVQSVRKGVQDAGSSPDETFEEGSGDDLLAQEVSDPGVRAFLEERRRHGATNEDLRRWHNLPLLEKKVLLKVDEWLIVSTYRAAMSEGRSGEEAARVVATAHARYTENAAAIGSPGSEDLLPAELKLRFNDHRMRRLAEDPHAFMQEVERAGDMNAYVREKLATGELR